MKTIYCLLLVTVLFAVGFAYPDRRGICLTFCGTFSQHQCPSGYECRSNGCGHECYRPVDYVAPSGCTILSCEGRSHCPLGYKTDSNGCDTCECDYSALKTFSQLG